jgi:hypothetical protein
MLSAGGQISLSTQSFGGYYPVMAWTDTKKATVVSVSMVLVVGITALAIIRYQAHPTYSWQLPEARFDVFYKVPPQVIILPTKYTTNGGCVGDSRRGSLGIAQPLREIVGIAYH